MLTLPREGYRSRVSDHVNRRDHEFFTILDAELVALDGSGRDWAAPVLMLARRHIRLILPAPTAPDASPLAAATVPSDAARSMIPVMLDAILICTDESCAEEFEAGASPRTSTRCSAKAAVARCRRSPTPR